MNSLNNRLIVKALEAYKSSLSKETVEGVFEANRIDEQIKLLSEADWPHPLLHEVGGAWLGVLRNWIQCKAINGERVTWGSGDMLQLPPRSVREMEFLAAQIATAARNEFRGLV